MKKIILVALTCTAFILKTTAQVSKGTIFLGTSIGSTTYSQATNDYSYPDGGSKTTTPDIYSLSLSPQAGVFVTNHVILGGTLGVSYSHNKTNTSNTETSASSSTSMTQTATFNLGPFMRYYFYETAPRKTMLYMQVQGTVGLGGGSSSGSGTTTTTTYTSSGTVTNIFTWTGGASVGVTHFVQHNIGLDFALGYSHSYENSNNTNSTLTTTTSNGKQTAKPNDYTLATNTDGFTVSLGFHWFIPRHS